MGVNLIAVVATPNEKKLVPEGMPCIVTGVGAVNVIRKLKSLNKDMPIYNVGFAGSNVFPVGTKIRVGKVKTYHPNVDFAEPEFVLDGDVPCYTSHDFVTSTRIKTPCVFDMELAFILALGFKHVKAEKIVSDKLNLKEYNYNEGVLNGET